MSEILEVVELDSSCSFCLLMYQLLIIYIRSNKKHEFMGLNIVIYTIGIYMKPEF